MRHDVIVEAGPHHARARWTPRNVAAWRAYVLIGGLPGRSQPLHRREEGRTPSGSCSGSFSHGIIGVIIIALIPKAKTEDDRILLPFTPGAGPGWFNDPQRRHELRYYDGTLWTEHVSDDGVQAVDGWMPPPPPPPPVQPPSPG